MTDFAFALETPDGRPTTPRSEQPAERLRNAGPAALSDIELLTILLQRGSASSDDARDTATRLLVYAGSLAHLLAYSPAHFEQIRGIGRTTATELAATLELGRRALMSSFGNQPILDRPEQVANYLTPLLRGLDVEKFYVLSLNRKNRLIRATAVTSGTATAALAHPREVFRQAFADNATAITVAHNHPSGSPAPSAADIHLTRQLREAARTVDIDLIDHVIVGTPDRDPLGRGYYSFREAGVL